MRNIPFSPPDITELEIQEVCEALRSGWITTGPRTKQLEKELAEYCHVAKLVCLNSATAAEEMNLRVLGIGEGDEVLVPAYTYTATAAAAIHVGATVKFIDSQKDSLEMDYDQMERAITERTKAVIPVDLGGIPCDYDRIYQAVEGKKALFCPKGNVQEALGRVAVVADCAHGLGASRHGVPTGALADFTSFSFHAVKNFTTAEGGASAWRTLPGLDDEELYHRYQLLSLHGQSKDALAKTKLGAWEYDIVGPWYKCNMTDIMAAIGLKQLERYPGLLEWPMSRSIIDGFNAVPKLYLEVGENIGLSPVRLVFGVFLPAALSRIFSGIKMGWARAWRGLISAEMLFGSGGSKGIGYYITDRRTNMDIAGVFATILVIILIGLVVEYGVFRTIENHTFKKWGMSR